MIREKLQKAHVRLRIKKSVIQFVLDTHTISTSIPFQPFQAWGLLQQLFKFLISNNNLQYFGDTVCRY